MTRFCSECGSSITLMRGHYERWYKDAKGGWLCARDYGIRYHNRHPDQGHNWRRKNKDYVNAYQRKYRAAKKQVAVI
ncbi:MAG: hypothetical protein WA323_19815 [Candidatus Nitrosopolaris sp.]